MPRNPHWDQLQGAIRHRWPFELRSAVNALRRASSHKECAVVKDVADELEKMARKMADAGENYRDGKPPFGTEAKDND